MESDDNLYWYEQIEYEPGFGGSPLLDVESLVVGMNIENYSSGSLMDSDISFAIPFLISYNI